MTSNFNTSVTDLSKDEWLTPPDIVRSLGDFDLDPCAPVKRPWDTAKFHYTVEDNGLLKPWHGRVWLNPPYGRETFKWLERLAAHGSGVALIFARTETQGFRKAIWDKAYSVFFFTGRLSFYHVTEKKDGATNAPSCLVTYSPKDALALDSAGFNGKHIVLR